MVPAWSVMPAIVNYRHDGMVPRCTYTNTYYVTPKVFQLQILIITVCPATLGVSLVGGRSIYHLNLN